MRFDIATSLDEALTALAAGAKPVAGGSDLVVGARQGKAPLPDHVIAIDRIDALRELTVTDNGASPDDITVAIPILPGDSTKFARLKVNIPFTP